MRLIQKRLNLGSDTNLSWYHIPSSPRLTYTYALIPTCHTPIPGPTRLADPNRVRGARPYTGTLYLIFFLNRTGTCGYDPHLITESKYHIHIKRTTTGVVSIKIYTHLPSPIYKYKTVLLHLQISAQNLHVVNLYKCVGPAICGSLQMSSPVPTRIKTGDKLYA